MIKWIRVIRRRIRIIKRVKIRPGKRERRKGLANHAESARSIVHSRLEYFNQFYNFKYGTVRIKSQVTRWGSCSSKGNLNFNYKIALIPLELADYLIVHELCHLGQFNHSQKFWDLVAQTIPDYKEKRAELKKIDMHS